MDPYTTMGSFLGAKFKHQLEPASLFVCSGKINVTRSFLPFANYEQKVVKEVSLAIRWQLQNVSTRITQTFSY